MRQLGQKVQRGVVCLMECFKVDCLTERGE
jgi:hypothetical protein